MIQLIYTAFGKQQLNNYTDLFPNLQKASDKRWIEND